AAPAAIAPPALASVLGSPSARRSPTRAAMRPPQTSGRAMRPRRRRKSGFGTRTARGSRQNRTMRDHFAAKLRETLAKSFYRFGFSAILPDIPGAAPVLADPGAGRSISA